MKLLNEGNKSYSDVLMTIDGIMSTGMITTGPSIVTQCLLRLLIPTVVLLENTAEDQNTRRNDATLLLVTTATITDIHNHRHLRCRHLTDRHTLHHLRLPMGQHTLPLPHLQDHHTLPCHLVVHHLIHRHVPFRRIREHLVPPHRHLTVLTAITRLSAIRLHLDPTVTTLQSEILLQKRRRASRQPRKIRFLRRQLINSDVNGITSRPTVMMKQQMCSIRSARGWILCCRTTETGRRCSSGAPYLKLLPMF